MLLIVHINRTNSSRMISFFAALLLAAVATTTTHGFAAPRSSSRTLLESSGLENRRPASVSLKAVIEARNGLKYEDIEIGTGRNIFPGDRILCYYVGTYNKNAATGGDNPFFPRGGSKVTFDETEPGEPAEVLIGKGKVIQGWDIGICGDSSLEIPPMKIGGDRKLIIPADLAYGSRGAGDAIPPNTDLEFQVAIVNAEASGKGVSGDTKLKGFAALIGFLGSVLVLGILFVQNFKYELPR